MFQSATFQVVIAADEFSTIVIFNYAKMDIPYNPSYLVSRHSTASDWRGGGGTEGRKGIRRGGVGGGGTAFGLF